MKTLRRLLSICLLLVATTAATAQTVSRVEYYWDTDPGRGHGTAITGWSAANQININTTISTAGLSAGIHTLGIRSRSNHGVWSPVYQQRVVVGKQVSRIEYFYDTDPGYGRGRAYTTTATGSTVQISDAQLSATGVSDGFHRLGLRAKAGTNGMWSPTYWQDVLVNGKGVVQVEYFYDSVPAYGEGTQYTAFTQGSTVTINNASLSAADVSDGFHRLGIRARAGGHNGMWSPVYWQNVLVNGKGVVQVEYFYDSVPAYGEGTQYTAFTQGSTVTINNAQLSAAGVSDGFHRLGIRAKAGGLNGLWSPVYWQNVLVNGAGITQVEYYWDDAHPAVGEATPLTGFTPGSTVNISNQQLSTAGLSTGVHRLSLRARTGNGLWSPTYFHEVFVGQGADYAEYYWDTDPGYGNATPIAFTPGEVAMVNLSNIAVPTSDGLHVLCLRARAGKMWSPTYTKTYCNAPTPQFSVLGGDTVCQGEQIIILDESEGTTTQSLYYWDMESDGTDDYTVHGDLAHTYSEAGVYTLTLGLGSDLSCRNTYSRTIMVRSTQSPAVSISRDRNGVCEGTEVRFVATKQRAEGYNPRLEWYRNDTLMAGLTSDTIYLSDLRNGDRIRALVRVYNPCATADSAWSNQLSMSVYSLPQVTLRHRRFVFTDETAFTLASRFQGSPAGGTYRLNGVESLLFNPSRNANGLYEVSYTYTNNNGCSSTAIDTFELRERVYYTLTAQADAPRHGSVTGSGSYVIGDTATVTALPAQYFVFDHWNDGDTTNPRRVEVLSDTTLTAYWLLVCPDTSYVFETEACDSYEWHGNTYTSSTNTPSYTSTDAIGCDSVTTLHLTVKQSSAATETVTACDSYSWHGNTYTSSTSTPSDISTGANGCDSVTTLHLTVNHSNTAVEAVTACNSYVWHGEEYTASTNAPTFTTQNAVGCDSVTTLHLTVNHCSSTAITACDSYTWRGTTYTSSGTYTDGTDTLVLTLNHSNAAVEEVTACDSYLWHGTTYTASTLTPTYTTLNATGCDSVTTLHLTLNSSSTATEAITACDSYTWHGTVYTTSTTTPTFTTQNDAGCDSVVTLHLNLNQSSAAIENVVACDSYVWHGTTYSVSTTTPTHTTPNAAGCDSVTTLHLTVNHSNSAIERVTACDSYSWHGTAYTVSTNTPTFTSQNVSGCDSVTTLHLTVNYSSSATYSATACDSYTWHGIQYTSASPAPIFTSVNAVGCDSVTTLNLTLNLSSAVTETITACDSYTWHGIDYIASTATPTFTSQNAAGCDSVTTLHLTVNHSNAAIETVTACDSYTWHGSEYTASTNAPTFTSQNAAGCDSVTTLHLTVNYSSAAVESITACDSYTWHGAEYTASTNQPTFSSTNAAGCSHVTTLHLTVNHSSAAIETVTACNSYVWHGTEYTASTNTPTFTSENAAGCDSVTTLHLTVNPCSLTEITACDSYIWRGTTYTVSGVYANGIDTLILTLGYSNTGTESVTACDSYTWHGVQYTASTNTPTFTSVNISGCDSVTTLHLTVNNSSVGIETVTACDSYTWHGTDYIASTVTPTFTSQNAAGCDSVTTLHLTVNHSTTSIETVTACDSYTWHSSEYTASTNAPTFTSQNAAGCDSVTTLHLTVNYSSASVESITVCDSYTWHGTEYTSSTDEPSFTTTNAAGCPSVTTLHLTVNYSSAAIETVTACNSYVWHGTEYTSSTSTPTFISENAAGCDSVTTLHLTITPCSSTEITACDSYTWHGTEYTVSGTYFDGIDTIHLTVNYSTTATESVTACDSYTWHGVQYTTSTNLPTFTSVNISGCDSVTTLHLTLNYSSDSIETVSTCNAYMWHGVLYTTSTNQPQYSTTNAAGCDSTVTLHLTIVLTFNVTFNANGGSGTMQQQEVCSGQPTVLNSCAFTRTGYLFSGWALSPQGQVIFVDGDEVSLGGDVTLYAVWEPNCTDIVSTEEHAACDSYLWHGTLYSTSCEARDTVTGVVSGGCDSIYILILTVNHSVTLTLDTTVTDSLVWDDITYSESDVITLQGTTAAGCDSIVTINLTVLGNQGIDEVETAPVAVYPNPTKGRVTIVATGIEKIELYDIYGRELPPVLTSEGLDLSLYPSGVYTLKITHAAGISLRRVIKK